ncbi:hypothetical protein MARHY0614 [Marinobacter nauticus ATCC 49840]|nr:hypothetical protein MARHY0614 [Marinobacter nauticus ATCC 49840]
MRAFLLLTCKISVKSIKNPWSYVRFLNYYVSQCKSRRYFEHIDAWLSRQIPFTKRKS